MDEISAVLDEFLTWMGSPLTEDGFFEWWMILCAGLVLIILLIAVLLIVRHRRKKKRAAEKPQAEGAAQIPTTLKIPRKKKPEGKTQEPGRTVTIQDTQPQGPLIVSNLQGLGDRTDQQDAFGMSPVSAYPSVGFTAVMCDGMGGMADGGRVARLAVERLLADSPGAMLFENKEAASETEMIGLTVDRIRETSKAIYRQLFGQGGSTLVMTYVLRGDLYFWTVGDSDLFLSRGGRLYALNERHEYQKTLLRKAAKGLVRADQAFSDPQAAALMEYVGKEDIEVECTRRPLKLQKNDRLLLCSDGVSDYLTLREIGEAMTLRPHETARKLEELIEQKAVTGQDNYTAIIIQYNE